MPSLRPSLRHVSRLLTTLAVLGTAHAGVRHLPVAMPPAALLSPSTDALLEACDAGFTAALAGHAPATRIGGVMTRLTWTDPVSPSVTLLTPAGSMAGRCASAVMDGRATEDARRAPNRMLWVMVSGRTQSSLRFEPQGWTVALSLQDAAGHELARVTPTMVAAGRSNLWAQSCATTCTWTGENRYGFDLGDLTADVVGVMPRVTRIMLDVDCPVPELLALRR